MYLVALDKMFELKRKVISNAIVCGIFKAGFEIRGT